MIDEYEALKARLEEHDMLDGFIADAVRVNDDGVPVADNYVVLSMSVPDEDAARFTAVTLPGADAEVVFNTQAVAVDMVAVMRYIEAIKAQVLGHVLTISGRTCTPIKRLPDVEEGEVRYDRTARLFYAHMSFAFWSKKAA